jgi:CheY-like chemotaxis protein
MIASRAAAVLVVDDVEDVRDLVALVLRNAGFVVRTAANGLEGLLTAYEMRPDVIVMDLTMPVLNGLEATRLIKATHATRESKVIAYTGNGSIPPPLERWFVAIVSKPSPPDVVLAAVQNAVSV